MRSSDLSSTTRLVLYEDIKWVLDSCWVEKTIHLVFAGFNAKSQAKADPARVIYKENRISWKRDRN